VTSFAKALTELEVPAWIGASALGAPAHLG
jgi:hypothetical protein